MRRKSFDKDNECLFVRMLTDRMLTAYQYLDTIWGGRRRFHYSSSGQILSETRIVFDPGVRQRRYVYVLSIRRIRENVHWHGHKFRSI